MEQQFENVSTSLKLKLRELSKEEEIQSIYQNKKYFDKLQLSVKFTSKQNHNYQIEALQLSKQSQLVSLHLKLKYITDFDLELLLRELMSLSNLKMFSLQLDSEKCHFQQINISLGDIFKEMILLERLSLNLDCQNIPITSNFLIINEAYYQLSQLTSLTLNFKEVDQNSISFSQIFFGLRNSKNLNELSVEFKSKQFFDANLYNFCDEIKYLKNLKKFEIILLSNRKMNKYQEILLSETILCFDDLEILKINIPIDQSEDHLIFEGIQYSKNLKQLEVSMIQIIQYSFDIKQLEQLQKCSQVEFIELQIQISMLGTDSNLLQKLFKSIHSICNISVLNISFLQQNKIDLFYFLQFISGLKSLKYLRKLEIKFQDRQNMIKSRENISDQIINDCIDVMSNLSQVEMRIKESSFLFGLFFADQYLKLFQKQEKLEKLILNLDSYIRKKDFQTQIAFPDFFNGKVDNIKEICFQFSEIYKISTDDFIQFFEKLKFQQALKKLTFEAFSNYNVFNEKLIQVMGNSISNLSTLKYLNFNLTTLIFEDFLSLNNFWIGIKNLSQLKELHLQFVLNLEINTSFTLMSEALENLYSLKKLKLKINQSERNNFPVFVEKKFKFPPNLNDLYFQIIDNKEDILFSNIKGVFKDLQNLQHLKRLTIPIQFETIELLDMIELSKSLENLKHLEVVKFDITNIVSIYLAQLMKCLPLTQTLILSRRSINQSLQSLQLQRTFTKQKILQLRNQEQEIDDQDSSIDETVYLKLQYQCRISKSDIKLVNMVFQNTTIHFLELRICEENIQINFIECLKHLTQLQKLSISIMDYCNLSSEYLLGIGEQLKYIPNLKYYQLYIGYTSGQIYNPSILKLFSGFKYLKLLESIHLEIHSCLERINDFGELLSDINHLYLLQELSIHLNMNANLELIGQQLRTFFKQSINVSSFKICFINSEHNNQQFKEFFKCFQQCSSLIKLVIPYAFHPLCKQLSLKLNRLVKLSSY